MWIFLKITFTYILFHLSHLEKANDNRLQRLSATKKITLTLINIIRPEPYLPSNFF